MSDRITRTRTRGRPVWQCATFSAGDLHSPRVELPLGVFDVSCIALVSYRLCRQLISVHASDASIIIPNCSACDPTSASVDLWLSYVLLHSLYVSGLFTVQAETGCGNDDSPRSLVAGRVDLVSKSHSVNICSSSDLITLYHTNAQDMGFQLYCFLFTGLVYFQWKDAV